METILVNDVQVEILPKEDIYIYKDIGSAQHPDGGEIRLMLFMDGGFVFEFPDGKRYAFRPEMALPALIKKLEEK